MGYGNFLYAEFTALADYNFTAPNMFIEMYNVEKDPHQLNNLANSSSKQLKATLHAMLKSNGSALGPHAPSRVSTFRAHVSCFRNSWPGTLLLLVYYGSLQD